MPASPPRDTQSARRSLRRNISLSLVPCSIDPIGRSVRTSLFRRMRSWRCLGMHEVAQFSTSSRKIAEAVQRATAGGAVSIVGGGDTIDFHTRYHEDLSH